MSIPDDVSRSIRRLTDDPLHHHQGTNTHNPCLSNAARIAIIALGVISSIGSFFVLPLSAALLSTALIGLLSWAGLSCVSRCLTGALNGATASPTHFYNNRMFSWLPFNRQPYGYGENRAAAGRFGIDPHYHNQGQVSVLPGPTVRIDGGHVQPVGDTVRLGAGHAQPVGDTVRLGAGHAQPPRGMAPGLIGGRPGPFSQHPPLQGLGIPRARTLSHQPGPTVPFNRGHLPTTQPPLVGGFAFPRASAFQPYGGGGGGVVGLGRGHDHRGPAPQPPGGGGGVAGLGRGHLT